MGVPIVCPAVTNGEAELEGERRASAHWNPFSPTRAPQERFRVDLLPPLRLQVGGGTGELPPLQPDYADDRQEQVRSASHRATCSLRASPSRRARRAGCVRRKARGALERRKECSLF